MWNQYKKFKQKRKSYFQESKQSIGVERYFRWLSNFLETRFPLHIQFPFCRKEEIRPYVTRKRHFTGNLLTRLSLDVPVIWFSENNVTTKRCKPMILQFNGQPSWKKIVAVVLEIFPKYVLQKLFMKFALSISHFFSNLNLVSNLISIIIAQFAR